jgi:hypothetical protein
VHTHTNPYERARFLAFLVHIVGDLHQPLHTVSLISARFPDGDRGGNLYYVRYKRKHVNLHKIWDAGVGLFEGKPTESRAHEISTRIMEAYSPSYFRNKMSQLKPELWADEGKAYAIHHVYTVHLNQPLTQSYIEEGRQVSAERAALAGYRLAAILNQSLTPST